MSKPTTAHILSTIANAHSIRTNELATQVGVTPTTAICHARKLVAQGFIFCEDDFEGRRRRKGKFTTALWVINCETCGFTPEVAQQAIDMLDGQNGRDIMVQLNLGI